MFADAPVFAASVGSVGDSYPLAESVDSDCKNELVDNRPLIPGAAKLSLATAEWVTFYNQEPPHSYCDDMTQTRRSSSTTIANVPSYRRQHSQIKVSGNAGMDQGTGICQDVWGQRFLSSWLLVLLFFLGWFVDPGV
ncbi:hypothetical protein EFY87_19965, partial [Flexivirga caeni]